MDVPEPDFDVLSDRLDELRDDQHSPEFLSILRSLVTLAENGHIEAAEVVAEICALEGPHRAPAIAYKWFYVALSKQGYSVEFRDQNNSPPDYRGPVGDFRNESMVSGLVSELGFDRVRELDREAAAWLRQKAT